MNNLVILILPLVGLVGLAGAWLGWQLHRQNGRLLLRIEELEKRFDEWEFSSDDEQAATMPTVTNGNERANRFGNRLLANSKIKRDGLKAGTTAPDFRLPLLDGKGDLSLSELRGKRVLLVFSSPGCGPCDALAPELEKFHRELRADRPLTLTLSPEGEREVTKSIVVVMISKGEPKENRAKVKEHGLTFPIVLQHQWEISRRYAMFATPVAYLIDEHGVIANDVAVGTDQIHALLTDAAKSQDMENSFALNSTG